jgi:hypothetical protein
MKSSIVRFEWPMVQTGADVMAPFWHGRAERGAQFLTD